ncbi:MAG: cation:proton antiporter, partial [Myxococcota bacterium]
MDASYVALTAGTLLAAAAFAAFVSSRAGLPVLVLFLVLGMLCGSEGVGGIEFDDPGLAAFLGDLALAVILLSGGLDAQWSAVRRALGPGIALSTVGVALTICFTACFAWWVFGTYSTFELGKGGLNWTESFLLAAIVASTDAAAVFSLIRTSNLRLKGDLRPMLELESGSNDPIAILLTIGFVRMAAGEDISTWALLLELISKVVMG